MQFLPFILFVALVVGIIVVIFFVLFVLAVKFQESGKPIILAKRTAVGRSYNSSIYVNLNRNENDRMNRHVSSYGAPMSPNLSRTVGNRIDLSSNSEHFEV